jgi:hypothetical protein
MSDIKIQLNFTEGIGNFYGSLVQATNFANYCKKINLTTSLYYNYRGCRYIKEDFYDIKNLFNIDNFSQSFLSIENTTVLSEITDYNYLYTPYLFSNHPSPGVHLWDLFIHSNHNDKKELLLEFAVSLNHQMSGELKEDFINIKIADNLINNTLQNKNIYKNALHIRTQDGHDNFDIIERNIDKINDLLLEKLLICSNSLKIRNYFKNHSNAIIIEERHPDIGYHHYFVKNSTSSSNDNLIENLKDTLIEMHNLSLCDKIYMITSYGIMSTFLFYAINNNRNLKLIYL